MGTTLVVMALVAIVLVTMVLVTTTILVIKVVMALVTMKLIRTESMKRPYVELILEPFGWKWSIMVNSYRPS